MTKPRFNAVDAAIILLLAAVIAAAVWYFASSADEPNVYVYFTVEFRNQPEGFEQHIIREIGGEARDSVRNYFLGHVYDVDVRPAHIISFDAISQTYVEGFIPERNDIFVTIRGRGVETNESIHVEGNLVTIGRGMHIRGRGFVNSGFVVALRTTTLNEE